MYFLKKLTEEEREEAIKRVRESICEAFPTDTKTEVVTKEFFNHKLEESMETKAVTWVQVNREFLDLVANRLHENGYDHNYPFTSGDKIFDEIIATAIEEIADHRLMEWSVGTQVRSYIANRMHDRQWIEGPRYVAGLVDAI